MRSSSVACKPENNTAIPAANLPVVGQMFVSMGGSAGASTSVPALGKVLTGLPVPSLPILGTLLKTVPTSSLPIVSQLLAILPVG